MCIICVFQQNPVVKSPTRVTSTTDVTPPRYVWVYPQYGRLGNAMFQYAAAMSVGAVSGHQAVIDCSSNPLPRIFPLTAARCQRNITTLRRRRHGRNEQANLRERRGWGTFDASLVVRARQQRHKHLQLCCYFQSWRYLELTGTSQRKEIEKAFEFSATQQDYARQYLQRILDVTNAGVTSSMQRRKKVTLIAVHVRRNDMTSQRNSDLGYVAAPLEYYNRAMTYYRKQYSRCLFLVASDDVAWCRRHLNATDVAIVHDSDIDERRTTGVRTDEHEIARDLSVLRLTNHSVISSGSFSWWIGWFTSGHVIYFRNYPSVNGSLHKDFNASDYYPQHWMAMT